MTGVTKPISTAVPIFLLFLLSPSLRALTVPKPKNFRIIVVGKIIIDEYGPPSSPEPKISIGGGGPQAAWGAAAALAARDVTPDPSSSANPSPLKQQPVTFVGPVGHDWTDDDASRLSSLLFDRGRGPCDAPPALLASEKHVTPRIRLWHDDEERVRWYPVDESFGRTGADGLWRDRPSREDVSRLLRRYCCSGEDVTVAAAAAVVHAIVEGGEDAAGEGNDASFLLDADDGDDKDDVLKRAFVGVEPVAFPNEELGRVSDADALACFRRLSKLRRIDALCPDEYLFEALSVLPRDVKDEVLGGSAVMAVREGSKGSTVHYSSSSLVVPAAKLVTIDSKPVNPTGAGNAYSAAFSALLGTGSDIKEAACLATGVGAVVCEWEGLPPWTEEVIGRVREAAAEVRDKLKHV
eukprot:CAMPEP_0172524008 /NCGR_PEP_ID=MMETSP1066-20121228/293959_1 /TAXON_ID=671091 /ORGANISM="Coscinodiscus wailesii, Strain CCMP2513" /LENGTH=408 /DNA_ID=CAMNT_0013307109 /DNA_START=49 /DNA_END=1275 /DNA_ORIENTATION=-